VTEKSIIIIGAGIAGLCAGVYARLNGYSCKIYEMHTQPGGLCTSWRRRGYTVDGCIHWLVGSNPGSDFNRLWQEVGLVQNRRFIDHDIYQIFEDRKGRTFKVYADADRLEREMLALAPQDGAAIRDFIGGVRFASGFRSSGTRTGLSGALERATLMLYILPRMRTFMKWIKTTPRELAGRFSDPLLQRAIKEMWLEDFSIFFVFMTLAWLDRRDAGYPLGGSMPMIRAVEERFLKLGGQVQYSARVEKILVEDGKAVGIRLVDGTEQRANIVISAADGHATIFDMLEGKFADDTIRGYYDNWKVFPPLVFIGLGVKRTFDTEMRSVTGTSFELAAPVRIGGMEHTSLSPHIFNFDVSMAPASKTTITLALNGDYQYWKALKADPTAYEAEKNAAGVTVIACLEQRFPGISSQVEMVDVSTPLTFERFTGNWQGSFEGWLMTPQNAMTQMKKTLPGLANFYMVGQWVMPGGGLPSGVQTARDVLRQICKQDNKRFTAPVE
jgi:phytoene dehydrogenase-like protein